MSDPVRLGLGTLQLARSGGWGTIERARAAELLEGAVVRGITTFDTAWYYGPDDVNKIIADALSARYEDLDLIAKIGNARDAARAYVPAVTPQQLVEACERSMRTLQVEQIPTLLLRWRADLGNGDDFLRAWETLLHLQSVGRARRIGLSNVSIANLECARRSGTVSAISNAFSIVDRFDSRLLSLCEEGGITFFAYYPLNRGRVAHHSGCVAVARRRDVSPMQVALAWLLSHSAVLVPLPGTSSLEHLTENLAATTFRLEPSDLALLSEPRDLGDAADSLAEA